jgi:hypothetical protein
MQIYSIAIIIYSSVMSEALSEMPGFEVEAEVGCFTYFRFTSLLIQLVGCWMSI